MAASPNVLDLASMSVERMNELLDGAEQLRDGILTGDPLLAKKLDGRLIANLFFENSTRTRCSFETAAKRLGAGVINLGSTSSVTKGETLVDTATNIAAMGVDALVVRCGASGGPAMIADAVSIPVINAGDGLCEHPTQGLLDLLTICRHCGSRDLTGHTVAIVGDIAHSRVARSNLHAVTACGGDVILVGPEAMVPPEIAQIPVDRAGSVTILHDLDAALESADVVMMLRVQFERDASIGDDYRQNFALTINRRSTMGDGVAILHPGPINRGLEIDPEVADGRGSMILEQVANGVAIRAAILLDLLGNPS
jgi:aspartate carbamoyltransferase catalytic subunit